MAKNLYITTTEAESGKSLITLGVMELLLHHIPKVGFFRPIVSSKDDRDIAMIQSYFHLDIDCKNMFGCEGEKAKELIATGQADLLLNQILEKYKQIEEKCDFVLCEGSDYHGLTSSFEFDINVAIANTLNCPVLLVINGNNKSESAINDSIFIAKEMFHKRNSLVIATIINRVNKNYPKKNAYTIPETNKLTTPTMRNVQNFLQADIIYGENNLDRRVQEYAVMAMNADNALLSITEGCLVVTSGDRLDIVFATILSFLSKDAPNIAGIVLTNKVIPEKIINILNNIKDINIPILTVKDGLHKIISLLENLNSDITPYDKRKILTSLQIFDSHIDKNKLRELIQLSKPCSITPKMFEYRLIKKAKSSTQHIVLPEGNEERILRAAEIITKRNFAKLTLLGNKKKIEQSIKRLDLHIDNFDIIDPNTSPKKETYAEKYYELRKHKGISFDVAYEVMSNVNYFATMMVNYQDADAMVSGCAHTTAETIRPALQILGTSPESSLVSSVFFMCLRNSVLVYADCAINPNPSAEQLAEIAIISGHTAKLLGIEPRIAMLSYSTGKSGKGSDVEKVVKATEIAQKMAPSLLIEGPLQYDAAVDAEIAKIKLPKSKVAGRATVFIFPDLNTGNNTYKAVQRSTGALAIGPILQGLRVPINDLSRGCTVPDIVNTVAITAIQAQLNRN